MFEQSPLPRGDGRRPAAPPGGVAVVLAERGVPCLPAVPSDVGVGPSSDDRAVLDERFERLLRAWWLDERPDWTGADWWDVSLRDDVRGLLWLPAGPGLAAALAEASTQGPCPEPHAGEAAPEWPTPGHVPGWPCACQVVVVAAWEACAAWVAAGAATALVVAAGPDEVVFSPPGPSPRVHEPAREELALALRVSPLSMGNRVSSARELAAHPGLVALVASAAISSWGARLVLREVAGLPDDVAGRVVVETVARIRARLASGRRPWTSAEVGRTARVLRLRLAPGAEQVLRQRARADRRVQVFEDRHGMAVLHALIDATSAHRIHRRLSAIAKGLEEPERSRDQVRADVLVDLLLGQFEGVRGPSAGAVDDATPAAAQTRPGAPPVVGDPSGHSVASGVAGLPSGRPEINVIVSLATLLGLAEDPAEVPGLGPIPAEVAQALAADGAWRAWVTDAAGAVVTTGSRSYVPSEGLARLVRAREPHCRMPGCRRPAQRCDLDHTVPWPVGATSASNLGPLCRRHHVLKTHAGWSLEPTDPPGPPGESPDGAPPGTGPPSVDPGGSPATPELAWIWRTPAGFTVRGEPDPPLG